LVGLQWRAAQEYLAQSLVMAKEICPLSKPVALPECRIAPLGALLNAEHDHLKIALRKTGSTHTNDQNITALWQQLTQLAAYGIGEALTLQGNIGISGWYTP
jgi:hypothetical protein